MRPAVWAPDASSVALVVDGAEHRMQRVVERVDAPGDEQRLGWWTTEVDLADGTDYAFAVDGGEPRPDPRSAWQPHGVHGMSRVVDTSRLTWTDDDWTGFALPSAVLYELHVGTFTPAGTFDAAIERLDHLVDLGITAVEVMPVNAFPGEHGWGYDGVGLYAVQDSYGGPHAMARFVDACHGRGIGVVLDVVYNHLGPDGNHLEEFGPYFTDRYDTPWGQAVNLDDAWSDHVRRFVVDNALRWLRDFHVDALRLDAVHALFDESAVHVLEQLAAEVDALEAELGRSLQLIAESELNDPRIVTDRDRLGYGLDASWSDDLHHAIHTLVTDERDGYYVDFDGAEDVVRALEHGWVYDGRWSPYRQRSHGRPLPDGLPSTRLVGFVQNHDQVGNRARGERLGQVVADPGLLAGAAALLLTAPQVPMLFMGEEWGASTPFPYFTDHQEPELQDAVREGRRSEFAMFGWAPEDVLDPEDPATFEAARLRWEEREQGAHARLLAWYRDLVTLRRAVPVLTDGDRGAVDATALDGVVVVRRGPVLLAVNSTSADRTVALAEDAPGEVLLRWVQDAAPAVGDGGLSLAPHDALVLADAGARDRWESARE